jgi:hypothetical protein
MSATLQLRKFGKPVRLLICTALACAISSITLQVIARSAGQPEYGMASIIAPAADAPPATAPLTAVA